MLSIYNCDMHRNILEEIAINVQMNGGNSIVTQSEYINNTVGGILHINDTSSSTINNNLFRNNDFDRDLISLDGNGTDNLIFEQIEIENNNQNIKGVSILTITDFIDVRFNSNFIYNNDVSGYLIAASTVNNMNITQSNITNNEAMEIFKIYGNGYSGDILFSDSKITDNNVEGFR